MEQLPALRQIRPNPVGGTLKHDLEHVLSLRRDTPVVTVLDRRGRATTLTGKDLQDRVDQTLQLWRNHIGPGPHVLVAALPAGEDFVVSLVASLIGEGTIVPVALPRKTDPPGRLENIARTCGATAVLCTSHSRSAVEAQLADHSGLTACSVLAIDAPEVARTTTAYIPGAPAYPVIQHTSGSTSRPKAVPISAQQIRENCSLIQSLWGMGSDTVLVNWLPHYHDMGLMGCIIYPLLSAAHSVQMSPFDMIRRPASWLEAISTHRGTLSGGPTFAFMECLERISDAEARDLDLSSWTRAFCGAEPIPSGLLDRFHDRFAANGLAREAVFACYGMAECTLFAAGEPGLRPANDDIPAPFKNVEGCLLSATTRALIRIADPETGGERSEGETGEVWVRGASLSESYLGEDDSAQNEFFTDADGTTWLRTGDLGGIHNGRLYVTGRTKDIIIVRGRNVASAEVEWLAAREHRDLNPSAAAAFALGPDENGDADLFIELRTGAAPMENPEAVAARIRKSLAASSGVQLETISVLRRGTLPRTSSGKIRRQQVMKDRESLLREAVFFDRAAFERVAP
ncbi:AMP-binding protein [Meridianimarinicoccus aquatilis]|uniref:AMP-binding protein n=1 Tax=Meridianimarinicoccus aquatilis TaxID=2552766 RepID=UPI0014048FBC|nr:AMP-binding protein [Fluviibacterium aquatile]